MRHCDVVLGFLVNRGNYGKTDISGLNAVQALITPGPMAQGGGTFALYVDSKANSEQRAALEAIFDGSTGGPPSMFAPMIATRLPTKSAPITFSIEVDYDITPLTNAIPLTSTIAVGNIQRYFSFDVDSNAVVTPSSTTCERLKPRRPPRELQEIFPRRKQEFGERNRHQPACHSQHGVQCELRGMNQLILRNLKQRVIAEQ